MIEVLAITIILVAVKLMAIGMEFNFIKWLKEGKDYKDKYDRWMSEKP